MNRIINQNEEMAREITGLETNAKHFAVNENSAETVLRQEAVEAFNNEVDKYVDNFNKYQDIIQEYSKSIVENCNNVEIMPIANYILIKPFVENPFQKIEVTESGLITDLGGKALTVKSNETGDYEEEERFIMVGNVIEVGPECKWIQEGDVVMWTKPSEVPVPFFKQGLVIVNENRIIVTVNEGLKKRFENGR